MPYTIRVDRPGGPNPDDNWVSWVMWAEKNAPFTDLSSPEMAEYLMVLADTPAAEILRHGGRLSAAATASLPLTGLTDDVVSVIERARTDGYGLVVEVFGQTIDQYLSNSGSA